MPFYYRFEYNDACNCHPEYHEEEIEADTLEELGRRVAQALTYCGKQNWIEKGLDIEDACYREPLQPVQAKVFLDALKAEAAPALEALKLKRAKEELEAQRAQLKRDIKAKETALNSLVGELHPEAVARRRDTINALYLQLEALRDPA